MTDPRTPQITPHRSAEGVLWYSFPLFRPFQDRFVAAFSSRIGGVCPGGWSSLNLGLGRGDEPDRVRENFARFGRAVGMDPARMVLSQQTHTTNLLLVDETYAGEGLLRPRRYQDVDGLVTKERNLPLVTFYADCTPLLFYAADTNIAGAAHAGWRGTVADMAGTMVRRLAELGTDPRHIYVEIGPSAGPCCYQVDVDTACRFRQVDAATVRPDPAAPGHYLADLWLANRILLLRSGVPAANIATAGLCTICHKAIFYSHRVQGPDRGALVGAVMLR